MSNVTYTDLLYELQTSDNIPVIVDLLPEEKQVFELDLNTRTINIPQFLSAQFDHNSEVIYFKTPRWFEGVDLTDTTCIIQYINADGDCGIYCVPFYDITHFEVDDKGHSVPMLLFPWSLGGLATVSAGTIKFSIRFYVLNKDTKKFSFNLNTKPAEGVILHGLDLDEDMIEQFKLDSNVTEQIYASIQSAAGAATTYWRDV